MLQGASDGLAAKLYLAAITALPLHADGCMGVQLEHMIENSGQRTFQTQDLSPSNGLNRLLGMSECLCMNALWQSGYGWL